MSRGLRNCVAQWEEGRITEPARWDVVLEVFQTPVGRLESREKGGSIESTGALLVRNTGELHQDEDGRAQFAPVWRCCVF